jgi:hypothetical protein
MSNNAQMTNGDPALHLKNLFCCKKVSVTAGST